MAQRVIVGLEPGAGWAALKAALLAAGATSVTDPSPAQPDAVVVTLDDERDAGAFLKTVEQLPGVRYAERDAWQSTF